MLTRWKNIFNYIELKHSIAKAKIIINDCQNAPYFDYQSNLLSASPLEYVYWDDERFEKLLEGYTMMTDCGYSCINQNKK